MSGIREDWLRLTQEEMLEPDLAIVDPHHHLWVFASHRYLLLDLLADSGSGHKIESTVFIECTACYRADGPPELRTLQAPLVCRGCLHTWPAERRPHPSRARLSASAAQP